MNASPAILVAAESGDLSPTLPAASQTGFRSPTPATVFELVYAANLKQFVANLRAIECPEPTVRDILIAEVGRRYRGQDEMLRSRPADHVAYAWSASTHEPALMERRKQAAAVAREKAALLRDALGYDIPVTPPIYAQSVHERRLQQELATLSAEQRERIRAAQERYNAGVVELQERTRGFWLEADVDELTGLKLEFRAAVDPILANPQPATGSESDAAPPSNSGATLQTSGSSGQFLFKWAAVETPDYRQYAANLRKIGFPEELVQVIVAADLQEVYAAREAALKENPVPYDAPMSQRQGSITPETEARLRQLRELQKEKQAVLSELLGVYVPREILRTPTSRNYDACEFALAQLKPEVRELVQANLEDFWMADDATKGRADYVEAYAQLREQWAAKVEPAMTAKEWERFQMQTMPPGTELARRVAGMNPSEDEMLAMFRLAYKCWTNSGGVYGLWRAIRVPPDQIKAAEEEMDQGLREVLGESRYLDYQLASTEIGQQLRNFAARFALPREILAEVFAQQKEAQDLSHAIATASRNPGSKPALGIAETLARVNLLNERSAQLLGPGVWAAWMDGKSRQVTLNPE